MNSIRLISSQLSSFPAYLSYSLNTAQKKVAAVVLFAFTCLSACYLLYHCRSSFKAQIVEQEKKNPKFPLPGSQPQPQPQLQSQPSNLIEKEKQTEVHSSETVIEKEKDKILETTISSWEELEAFCHADERKDLKVLEIPGQGTVSREHVEKLLANKAQLPAWNSQKEHSLLLANGEITFSGLGLTKIALCLDNLDFRNFFRDIDDNKVDLTSVSASEWKQLLNDSLDERQAIHLLQNRLVQTYSCFHNRLQSILNRKDRLFSLPATQERLQLIQQILIINQKTPFSTLQQACSEYFTRALNQSETECAAFYEQIQQEPLLVDAFFEAVYKLWENRLLSVNEQQTIRQNLLSILKRLTGNEKFNYFERLLQGCAHSEWSVQKHTKECLRNLTDQEEQDLAQSMTTQAKHPGKSCHQWVNSLEDNSTDLRKQDNQERILKTIVPTLNNLQDLKDLTNAKNYFEDRVLKHLSIDQYKTIIQSWQTELFSEKSLQKISSLIYHLYEMNAESTIEQILKEMPTIKLKKLMISFKDTPTAPYIASLYVLEGLNSNKSPNEKKAKILIALSHLSSWQKDHHHLFASFLAKICSAKQVDIVVRGFLACSGIKQNLGESFLTTLLANGDLEKIESAFNVYWWNWKSFNTFTCGCSATILPYIKSEDVLKAVYEAIPSSMSRDEKLAIHKLLREPFLYHNFGIDQTYRVDLAQDVIDRIVV